MDNSRISKHLGQTSKYKSSYDPTLLVSEPRQGNRAHLGIKEDEPLPFTGFDVWNAYEISALLDSGVPFAGVAKIMYPCSNKYIVESKSIKLYLNSFNMTKVGRTAADAIRNMEETVTTDLSKLLETQVSVTIHDSSCIDVNDDYECTEYCYDNYTTLESVTDISALEITSYAEDPSQLIAVENRHPSHVKAYHSALLKSNCRVTSQPDFGDVYISYKGKTAVAEESLLKYIISFRDECHFHEEICETIYMRLWDVLSPEYLRVTCLYTRRGGIDICPHRVSGEDMQDLEELGNTHHLHVKTPRQ